MSALELAHELGHEEVLLVQDRSSRLRAVIALHDTTLGPAVGGTRMRLYPSPEEALVDALRLSRAMTCKAVLAEMPYGGGKGVILGDPGRDKTRALLLAYGGAVERLGGRFHTGCDMGIGPADVSVMAEATGHVSHAHGAGGIDTAELAALGVLESIRAVARLLDRDLSSLHVAVQGLGEVGGRLARLLAGEGARLTLADLDAARAQTAARELGAAVCPPEDVYALEADVFSPNAAGGVLNDDTVPRLRCRAVVGAANEQLAAARHGDGLFARGVVYAPDYVVNAGGLISLLFETGATDRAGVIERVKAIGPRLLALLERARAQGRPPHRVADQLVEERLRAARARRAAAF